MGGTETDSSENRQWSKTTKKAKRKRIKESDESYLHTVEILPLKTSSAASRGSVGKSPGFAPTMKKSTPSLAQATALTKSKPKPSNPKVSKVISSSTLSSSLFRSDEIESSLKQASVHVFMKAYFIHSPFFARPPRRGECSCSPSESKLCV
ncbi:hypothetical protein NE237_013597 [Protea cynaroides]|uniref:Uncharacterized protein n=1 Tax=Protea cynaroides TaxID=273540 RepID=A0A9Q0H480_9MAGN|nr:hypothetical protein NE237_013597 [Protea cynaroides]